MYSAIVMLCDLIQYLCSYYNNISHTFDQLTSNYSLDRNMLNTFYYTKSRFPIPNRVKRLCLNIHKVTKFYGHNAYLHFCVKSGVYPKKLWQLVKFKGELDLLGINPNILTHYNKFIKEIVCGIIAKGKIRISELINQIIDDLTDIASTHKYDLIYYTIILANAVAYKTAEIHHNKHTRKFNTMFYNYLFEGLHSTGGIDFELTHLVYTPGTAPKVNKAQVLTLDVTHIADYTNMFRVEPRKYLPSVIPHLPHTLHGFISTCKRNGLFDLIKVNTIYPLDQIPKPTNVEDVQNILSVIGSTFRFPIIEPDIMRDEIELDRMILRWKWHHIFNQDTVEPDTQPQHTSDADIILSPGRVSLDRTAKTHANTQIFGTSDDPPLSRESSLERFIPFEKNQNKLPTCPDPLVERQLLSIKTKLLHTISSFTPTQHMQDLNRFQHAVAGICKQHKLLIVGTDKTKRNLLIPQQQYVAMGEKFLNGSTDYIPATQTDVNRALQRAHEAIRSIQCKLKVPDGGLHKLLPYQAHAANLTFLIKDHKPPVDLDLPDGSVVSTYPLRPIASVHGTPCDTIDWVVQPILTELVSKVAANLMDAPTFKAELGELPVPKPGYKYVYFSLDVVNLYPTVDTRIGIRIIQGLLAIHSRTNLYGLSREDVVKLLDLLCDNYYVGFNNVIYKQVKGVPMGARFAPPFAILLLDHFERIALRKLPAAIRPVLYRRYIDDIVYIAQAPQAACNMEIGQRVLRQFNSIHPSVQFTIEMPDNTGTLPFLDLQFQWTKNQWMVKWYQKSLHSGNMIHNLSHIPQHTKHNVLINRFSSVMGRSNHSSGLNEGIAALGRQMLANGYDRAQVNLALSVAINKFNHPPQWAHNHFDTRLHNSIMVQLPFYADHVQHTLKGNCHESQAHPLVLIQKRGLDLRHITNTNTNSNRCILRNATETCTLCPHLQKGITCARRGIVYSFKCTRCGECYIGKANRTLRDRFQQHVRDFRNRAISSPLFAHIATCTPKDTTYPLTEPAIGDFSFSVLNYFRPGLETDLAEAWYIRTLRPKINRKQELTEFY